MQSEGTVYLIELWKLINTKTNNVNISFTFTFQIMILLNLLNILYSLQLVSSNNVAMYGGLCALASFDRQELQKNVISSR